MRRVLQRIQAGTSGIYAVLAGTLVWVLVIAKHANHQADTRGEDSAPAAGGKADDNLCPLYPDTLLDLSAPPADLASLASALGVGEGGVWSPPHCTARQRLAIIIPYRDRWGHLRSLLTHLHPMLQRQQLSYRIIVVEQAYNLTFNKGLLMNLGYLRSRELGEWDCVIFHDVDMIPEHDHNLYQCGDQPRHLSPALDEMRYALMYPNLVGGVLALSPRQLWAVNGYSNMYWGWGAEDDDMSLRIEHAGYVIERPPSHIGRYKMVRHQKREMAQNRVLLLSDWRRYRGDGLNSVPRGGHSVLSVQHSPLYTNITVDVGTPPAQQAAHPPGWWQTLAMKVQDIITLYKMDI